MSVVMTLRVRGDGKAAEALAAQDPSIFSETVEGAKERGVISHHFFANDDEILVVDEWPDEKSFQEFFHDAGPQIQQIMGRAGVTSEPEIKFWHKLETGDDVG
jgi:quinol monooxygenase YgiN